MIKITKQVLEERLTGDHKIGPSRVRALPLAAGINIVAIVLGIIFVKLQPKSLVKKTRS